MMYRLFGDNYLAMKSSWSNMGVLARLKCSEDQLSATLWQEAAKCGLVGDIDGAIFFGGLAVHHLTSVSSYEDFRTFAYNLCFLHEKKWLRTRKNQDKDDLIFCWQKYLDIEALNRNEWYENLSTENLQARHGYSREKTEEKWLQCFEIAKLLTIMARNRREEAYTINQVGILHYRRAGFISDFSKMCQTYETGVLYQERAISLLTKNDVINHGIYLGHLGFSHRALFKFRTEESLRLKHCNAAIESFEKTTEALGTNHALWQVCSDALARLYWSRWLINFEDGDIMRAIEAFQSMLEIDPKDSNAQSGLAELYNQRAEDLTLPNFQRRAETNKCLELLEDLIVQTDLSHSELPSRLGKCSNVLKNRFLYDGALEDIDAAIELQKCAISLPQVTSGALWFHYAQLSSYWRHKFQSTGIQTDIEAAEEAAHKAMNSSGSDQERRERALRELGLVQMTLFNWSSSNDITLIDKSIANIREVLALRANIHNPTIWGYLGSALMAKFGKTELYETASEGIKCLRKCVDIFRERRGKGRDPNERSSLSDLAKAYIRRFQKYAGKDDIDEAIRLSRKIADEFDDEHTDMVDHVVDLCFALGERYELEKRDQDIDEAQSRADAALAYLRGRPEAKQLRLLNSLGMINMKRYDSKGEKESRMAAFRYLTICFRAILIAKSTIPYDNEESIMRNLAQMYYVWYVKTESERTLKVVLKFYRNIILIYKKTSRQPPDAILTCVAKATQHYRTISRAIRPREDKLAGKLAKLSHTRIIKQNKVGTQAIAESAIETAQLCFILDNDFEKAKYYSEIAVRKFLEATMLGLSRVDHIRIVQKFSRVPVMELFLSCITDQQLEQALQKFENSRTLIWNRLLDHNTPLEELQEVHPQLANRFRNLSNVLSEPHEQLSRLDTDRMKYDGPDYYQIATDYHKVLQEIRGCTGFEEFMLVSSSKLNFKQLSSGGPIVVVNLTSWVSHAIIIQESGIQAIRIPMRDQDGQKYYDALTKSISICSADLSEANHMMNHVMQLLWDGVAKHVLDALGFKKPTSPENVPHIWWVTNGWLGVLPIHSAASFSDISASKIEDSVLDRVISSYVPNLRALASARQRQQHFNKSPLSSEAMKAVLIPMSSTPGYDALPNAETEIAEVSKLLTSNNYNCMKLERPNRQQTMREMNEASIIHFVCHGVADEVDPTKSRLLLMDHLRFPLDVRALHRVSLKKCYLAYLSACEMATSKCLALKDEQIHIAAAILIAGVPSVIATWWRIVDELSVSIASGFYEGLFKSKEHLVNTTSAANAIHSTTKDMRDQGVSPLVWAAYAHFGA